MRSYVRPSFRASVDTMRWVACGSNSSDLFEILQVFLSWFGTLHLILWLSFCCFFLSTFFFFYDLLFFQVRLLLDYLVGVTTDQFDTMHTCSTWSVDVHVVFGLSCRYFLSTFSTFSA